MASVWGWIPESMVKRFQAGATDLSEWAKLFHERFGVQVQLDGSGVCLAVGTASPEAPLWEWCKP